MRTTLKCLVVLVWGLFFFVWLSGCASHSLPHRQPGELFPQAISPPAACKDQYAERVTIPNSDGTFFLECWGGTTT